MIADESDGTGIDGFAMYNNNNDSVTKARKQVYIFGTHFLIINTYALLWVINVWLSLLSCNFMHTHLCTDVMKFAMSLHILPNWIFISIFGSKF